MSIKYGVKTSANKKRSFYRIVFLSDIEIIKKII